ncbi:hypothetical protein A3D00_05005 [Candidatus Woesebacteria bacterium RIFCSPHIGHO2_02_FULL_38_9]|nr:MAG: hypothetical protein A3D00_05005 [Candidatus Woesebacteria bacterium RIFCSPHIGHO2_02_FULL_38_9]
MSKIICIDARMWGVKNTGIGRYVEELIENLPDDPQVKIVLIVPPDLEDEPKLSKFGKVYARYRPYTIRAQFEILYLLIKIKPDLLHVPHFTIPVFWPGKMIVTIHDLIKHLSVGPSASTHSPIIYWIKYYLYLILIWFVASRVDHILAPAKYWKDALIKKYNLTTGKISVTYEGVSKLFSDERNVDVSYKLKKPYIIYVGNLYPHKNVPLLLDALSRLKNVNLVIVCARNVFRERFEKMVKDKKLEQRTKFLNNVPDDTLANIYKNSVAFVTPSLIEGFGLPGLEAMAVGTPVIAAKASCLPEIYEDAALFFDPYNAKELSEKIKLFLNSEKMHEKYIKRGFEQVKKYSWQKMASQTWQIYLKELQ